MSELHQLGDLQLAIMRVLWEFGEASSSHVRTALSEERGLALTTIATILHRMEEKGVVAHRSQGRQFIYRALIDEADVREGMVGDLVGRMFCGDSTALVNHLIDAGEIDAQELDELRARIARRRKKG